jgi:uncharacterized protein YraI
MHRTRLVASLGVLLLTAFGVASAQNAYTSRPMNLRAGPNRDYPLVAQLDQGAPLDVHGCLNDWSWCDVSSDDTRGWMYAGGVSFVYEGGRVPIYSYGPRLGLPILSFSLMTYWGDYYRGRPWYAQRNDWVHRRMPPRSIPHGRPNAGPPPGAHGRAVMAHGGPPMSHGRPPAGGRAAPRSEQHGHAAMPARPMERQSHAPAPPQHGAGPGRSQGHTSGHASGHAEHGNEHRGNPP